MVVRLYKRCNRKRKRFRQMLRLLEGLSSSRGVVILKCFTPLERERERERDCCVICFKRDPNQSWNTRCYGLWVERKLRIVKVLDLREVEKLEFSG